LLTSTYLWKTSRTGLLIAVTVPHPTKNRYNTGIRRRVVTLDGNPLQKPIERLKSAGIANISISDIDGVNWGDFLAILYCDDAILYFYNAAKEIENELRKSADYPFESSRTYIVPLPDLGDSSTT
jgi:hypothetical protein